jgi:excisionase family DNA binding protein
MENLEQRIETVESAVKMAGLATKDVLTFDEAARFTGLSKSYLYKLTSGAKIAHYKPSGKMCYFNRLELEAWLQQNRVSTSDEIEAKAQTYCIGSKKKGGKK